MKIIPLIVLAMGNFAVGTAELVIAGVLPLIARDVKVSLEAAGQLVTIYALVFALGAPVLTGLTRRIERRRLLLLSLGLFILGNLLTIVAADYALLVVARIIAASGSAIFSVQTTNVTARLTPIARRGQALAIVVAGFSAALVLGVPAGTFIGQNFGWRLTFGLVILLSLVASLGIRLVLPLIPAQNQENQGHQLQILKQTAVFAALTVSLLTMTGQYVLYTYLPPFLEQTARLRGNEISLVFLVYGFVGIAGSLIGGYAVDRLGLKLSLLFCIALTALPLLGLNFLGASFGLAGVLGAVIIWGLCAWGFTPIQQYRLLNLAPGHSDLVLSLNLSTFNLGIAAGSAIGGVVIGSGNLTSLNFVGGLIIVPAVIYQLVATRA